MSHAATNWAIKQRGLRPAAKIVLWYLCDRYHPDNGCFPSQDMLAEDCEMSRSALNSHLAALEEAGLIRREQQFDPETKRRDRTHYRFPFEEDWPGEKPCRESGHGAMSGKEAEPCPDLAQSHVRNPDNINPVREPVTEPVERDARASGQETKIPNADLLERLIGQAPQAAHDSQSDIERAWAKLSPAQRREAEARYGEWRAAAGARKIIAGLPAYLGERRWEKLPKRSTTEGGRFVAGAFDRDWWIIWHKRIAAGKSVDFMVAQAIAGKPWAVDDQPTDVERTAFVSIMVGSPECSAWQRHAALRLRTTMPMPDKAQAIFVPSAWPPQPDPITEIADMERAAG